MGGSTADTPITPESLRASDAERDHAVSELRNEFAEGRLSHETFMYRMQSALDARRRGQLVGLFTDLPPRRPGLMARIKAMLRGEDPEALQSRPDGNRGIPRTQQVAGSSYGPVLPYGAPPPAGWESPPAPPAGGFGGDQGFVPPGASRAPAPLVFPPGNGVRFTIGRTRDCDLCLTDLSVSRMHALLVRREDGWVLSDLGSHNGTRLNGWLVREPVQVRAGDRVEFGSMTFIIQGDPPAMPPPAVEEEEEEGPGLADTGP
jgi:FHA domain/Domain of unknown function (DUF1707)